MFRSRAVAKEPATDLDRPFRLITAPAKFGLIVGVIAAVAGLLWLFGGQIAVKASATGLVVNPPGNLSIFSPANGFLDDQTVIVGTEVRKGDVLLAIDTFDGKRITIASPIDGTVVSTSTELWAQVTAGAPLLDIAPATGPLEAIMFVPVSAMADVEVGQRAEVSPVTTDPSRDGFLIGQVDSVNPLPATLERLALILGDDGMIEDVTAQGPVQEVTISFDADPSAPLGLRWSGTGPDDPDDTQSGTVATGKIVLRNQTPWQAFTGN